MSTQTADPLAEIPARPPRPTGDAWRADLRRHLAWLTAGWDPGWTLEIRAVPNTGRQPPLSGLFANPDDDAAEAVERLLDQTPLGAYHIYAGLNPRRRPATGALRPGPATGADDVAAVTAALLDFDPQRPPHSPATDEEWLAAAHAARRAAAELRDRTGASPLVLSSGNGIHLLYRVPPQNPARFGAALRHWLAHAASLWDTPAAHVDTGVADPPRIAKAAGTWAAKGRATADRPWRRAAILVWADPEPSVALAREIFVIGENSGGDGDRRGGSRRPGAPARLVPRRPRRALDSAPPDDGRPAAAPRKPRRDLAFALKHCEFLRYCRENAETLPEPLWYAMITNLVLFEGGEEAIHELSRPYPRYSRRETEAKIAHALKDSPGPMTCIAIADRGFACPLMVDGTCPSRAPAALASAYRCGAPETEDPEAFKLSERDRRAAENLWILDYETRKALQESHSRAAAVETLKAAAQAMRESGYSPAMRYLAIRNTKAASGISDLLLWRIAKGR